MALDSHPLIVVVEQATLDDEGRLGVSGWAAGGAGVERVEIEIGGRVVGRADYGRPRPDVAADHPKLAGAAACGFALSLRLPSPAADSGEVVAFARDQRGAVASATRPIRRSRALRLNCDRLEIDEDGAVSLSGWAVHADEIAGIEVRLGDACLGRAELGGARPDLARLHPELSAAGRSGFRFRGEAGPVSGEVRLTLSVVTGKGERFFRDFSAVARPPQPRPAPGDIRLALDAPRLVEGRLAQPVQRMLALEGWAAARHGLSALEAFLDDAPAGEIKRGVRRRDIAAAFPDWPEALHSGFALILPRKAFSGARQALRLVARDARGATQELAFAVELAPDSQDDAWLGLRRSVIQAETNFGLGLLARAGARPFFHVAVTPGEGLDATLASLRAQTYPHFAVEAAPPLLRREGERVFFMRLRAGDLLAADALMEFALEIAARPELDFLYADDRRPDSGRIAALLKPAWSPDLLLSTNYIGRAFVARADLAGDIPAGDYDLVLRLTEAARAIGHIPRVLAETPAQDDDEAKALDAARLRRGIAGAVEPTAAPRVFRLRRAAPEAALASIVIPTIGAGGFIEACLASIRRHTRAGTYEIVCVDNIADAASPRKAWLKRNADIVVECPEPFNWSRLNNLGAAAARGDYLMFLNDDTEVVESGWLDALLEQASRREIGVVGPRLLYPDGRVQQAGMYLAESHARHAFAHAAADDPGPFGLALAQRDVACVTGACMLMRREVFEVVGGFDEAHAVVNNDIDMCLKLRRAGLAALYTPHATLIHREMASRGAIEDAYDAPAFSQRWGRDFALGDPFLNPGLSREDPGYAPEPEPTRLIVAGRPLLAAESVARILVVKLDHVGDFVTALPAIRRLKAAFPQAGITLLAAPASVALAQQEPAIARTIPFSFFSAVSQEGVREIGAQEWRALEANLKGLDVAIDLRKQAETREVLARAEARLKAGFDAKGAFPWLDVALEWETDVPYRPKRSHVSDDVLALVEAVARACAPAPPALLAPPALHLPEPLAGRPFVVVHPGAGSALRQWPLRHFRTLIDLLLADFDVEIALIGTKTKAALAEPLLRDGVASLIGRTRIEDLPGLLAAARLFVGANSGPHHMAAAVGTPTVGVHSGVASAREWGPVGPLAVAVQRQMSCAPCYLDRAERCPRSLACLAGLRPAEVFRICERMLEPELRRRP